MIRTPPRPSRTDTVFPSATLFRSHLAVERQFAPLDPGVAVGGKDHLAVEGESPRPRPLDVLRRSRRQASKVAILLYQRRRHALFDREARLFVHMADLAMHRDDQLRTQPAIERGEFGLSRMAADVDMRLQIGRAHV